MDGVIGETVKLRDFEYGQNRDIFALDLAAGNRVATFRRGLIEKWAFQAVSWYGNQAGA
jgi:hypothetical protein